MDDVRAARTCEIVRVVALDAPDLHIRRLLDLDRRGFSVVALEPPAYGREVQFQFETTIGVDVILPAIAFGYGLLPNKRVFTFWVFASDAAPDAIELLEAAAARRSTSEWALEPGV